MISGSYGTNPRTRCTGGIVFTISISDYWLLCLPLLLSLLVMEKAADVADAMSSSSGLTRGASLLCDGDNCGGEVVTVNEKSSKGFSNALASSTGDNS